MEQRTAWLDCTEKKSVCVVQRVPTGKGRTLRSVQITPVVTSMLWQARSRENATCSCAKCLLASIPWEPRTCAYHQKCQAVSITTARWMMTRIPKSSSPTVMYKPTQSIELFSRTVRLCCESCVLWRKMRRSRNKTKICTDRPFDSYSHTCTHTHTYTHTQHNLTLAKLPSVNMGLKNKKTKQQVLYTPLFEFI